MSKCKSREIRHWKKSHIHAPTPNFSSYPQQAPILPGVSRTPEDGTAAPAAISANVREIMIFSLFTLASDCLNMAKTLGFQMRLMVGGFIFHSTISLSPDCRISALAVKLVCRTFSSDSLNVSGIWILCSSLMQRCSCLYSPTKRSCIGFSRSKATFLEFPSFSISK